MNREDCLIFSTGRDKIYKGDLLYLTEDKLVKPLDTYLVKPIIGIAKNNSKEIGGSIVVVLNGGKFENFTNIQEKGENKRILYTIGNYIYYTEERINGVRWSLELPTLTKQRKYRGGIMISETDLLVDIKLLGQNI